MAMSRRSEAIILFRHNCLYQRKYATKILTTARRRKHRVYNKFREDEFNQVSFRGRSVSAIVLLILFSSIFVSFVPYSFTLGFFFFFKFTN